MIRMIDVSSIQRLNFELKMLNQIKMISNFEYLEEYKILNLLTYSHPIVNILLIFH